MPAPKALVPACLNGKQYAQANQFGAAKSAAIVKDTPSSEAGYDHYTGNHTLPNVYKGFRDSDRGLDRGSDRGQS